MRATGSPRRLAVRLHRWIGLALGGWFALAGLSGALLVWHAELDAALNPAWFDPRPACAAAPARPVAAALAVHARAGGAAAQTVTAPARPGAAYLVAERAAPGAPRREHFVDAGCGLHLGSRERGAPRADRAHLVPALYELHRSMLAGAAGHAAAGLAGLALAGAALAGLAAAWPRPSSAAAWRRALSVRRGGPAPRFWYDLHRAAGLWLLPFLLLMAATGAYLCFPQQGRALVGALLPTLDGGVAARAAAAGATPDAAAPAGPDALVAAAGSLWPDARWSRLQLPGAGRDFHEVRLLQRGEPRADTGDTRVRLAADGTVLAVRDALRAPAGETLLGWLFPLHSGEALGLPGRLAWTVLGAAPALFLATGGWLWWRRRARRAAAPARAMTVSPSPSTPRGACE